MLNKLKDALAFVIVAGSALAWVLWMLGFGR